MKKLFAELLTKGVWDLEYFDCDDGEDYASWGRMKDGGLEFTCPGDNFSETVFRWYPETTTGSISIVDRSVTIDGFEIDRMPFITENEICFYGRGCVLMIKITGKGMVKSKVHPTPEKFLTIQRIR